MNDKDILIKQLSDLLGYDGGVSDVLEHLLTIESYGDLLDFLSQFLGPTNEVIRNLAEDIGRFQRGEPIQGPNDVAGDNRKMEAKPRESSSLSSTNPTHSKLIKLEPAKSNVATTAKSNRAPPKPAAQKKQMAARPGGPNTKSTGPKASPQVPVVTTTEAPTSSSMNSSPIHTEQKDTKNQPQVPARSGPLPQGKAPYECGCFGNLHRALTNCLYCGRIACEREGYNFCPFCGYLVEEVKPPPEQSMDKAWLHKERLLRYDQDFEQRTIVLDDQADHYAVQAVSNWLSDAERAEAARNEDERQDKLLKRDKFQLKLAI